jgi:uncharacterized protein
VIVVSDISPIRNLGAVGHLQLLRQLYGEVVTPLAFFREMTVGGAGRLGGMEVQTPEWIKVREVTDRTLVTALQMELDVGEAEAIALAKELAADLLLMDERRGRDIAAHFGLRVIGLLGVLIEAKQRGNIPAVKPILDDLRTKAGFWVSQQLYVRVLQAAGE